ncbi:MAG: hypothetical protein HQL57_08025 [Magnetococcales bacterium]|nr:hypothetical protein [Magnetococcales bacterium]MBF0157114.1 hypothetical protein [Magnetococcales bacterium]
MTPPKYHRRGRTPVRGIRGAALACLLPVALLSGCLFPESYPLVSQPLSGREAPGMGETTYRAADSMVRQLGDSLRRGEVILPTSFVNQNDFEKTSPMGRLLASQIASRFTQAGFPVVEIKLRRNLLLQKNRGQFLLSSDLDQIRNTHKVDAVLTGTYLLAETRVHVSAQLVRLKDGVVLAADEFSLPVTKENRALLVETP